MKNATSLVFDYIQGINANSSTMSSIGTFVTAQAQQVADMNVRDIVSVLIENDKKETLAFKILSSPSTFFSEKQIWVIAFELVKIDSFVVLVSDFYAKKEASKNKLAANKEASSDVLAQIKNAGKKLGDYFIWVKKSSFKKEFFNKKYSQQSVSEFISL